MVWKSPSKYVNFINKMQTHNLVCMLLDTPTFAIEPSMQLDLESDTAISDSHWRIRICAVWCGKIHCALDIILLTNILIYTTEQYQWLSDKRLFRLQYDARVQLDRRKHVTRRFKVMTKLEATNTDATHIKPCIYKLRLTVVLTVGTVTTLKCALNHIATF